MAISAELFCEVGGFEASFPRAAGEDGKLCDRLVSGGHPVLYAPEALGMMFMLGMTQVATGIGFLREGLPAIGGSASD
jgi:hypothetical protein